MGPCIRHIKGEPRQPVPGINSDHVPASISDRARVGLEEDQPDARLAQQDEFIVPPEAREVSIPPERLVTQVEVRSNTWLSSMCLGTQSSPSQSLGHV